MTAAAGQNKVKLPRRIRRKLRRGRYLITIEAKDKAGNITKVKAGHLVVSRG